MRAVVQRVLNAELKVEGKLISKIGRGLVVFFGVKNGDVPADADKIVKKISALRIFEDENGKMNLSVGDVGGEVLFVSQFTLYGDASHGNRPSFTEAARPETAKPIYDYAAEKLRSLGVPVSTGIFGADMKILQENQCLGILGGDIHLYKDNLKLLTEQKQIIIRIPVIGGYTDGKNNREAIIKEIKRYENRILKIEMIKGHNLGKSKYESLNMEIPQCNDVSDDFMEQYRKEIENVVNIPVLICRI